MSATIEAPARTSMLYRMPCPGGEHYDVLVTEGLFEESNTLLLELLGSHRQALIVTTPTVARLHAASLASLPTRHEGLHVLTLPCSEAGKSLAAVQEVCARAASIGLKRHDVLVAFGGGVCSDIVTMAASLIRRGIDHIRVPTTLIGQIDAAIGVKGAVNFHSKKSFLGTFYPPEAVLLDHGLLRTLNPLHLRQGLAEIVKIALATDSPLFNQVAAHVDSLLTSRFQRPIGVADQVLGQAAARMLEQLEPNLFEDQTFERLVDLGHTFSPLLEAASDFTMPHGDSVAIDTALSSSLAVEMGLLAAADRDRILAILLAAGLPIWTDLLTPDLCARALEEAARHRGGHANLVLPVAIGSATFAKRPEDVPIVAMARAARLLEERAATAERRQEVRTW
jgi:3-dehydroquinate synthase